MMSEKEMRLAKLFCLAKVDAGDMNLGGPSAMEINLCKWTIWEEERSGQVHYD